LCHCAIATPNSITEVQDHSDSLQIRPMCCCAVRGPTRSLCATTRRQTTDMVALDNDLPSRKQQRVLKTDCIIIGARSSIHEVVIITSLKRLLECVYETNNYLGTPGSVKLGTQTSGSYAQRNRCVEDKTFNTSLQIVWCIADGIDGRCSCIPGVKQAFLLAAHASVVVHASVVAHASAVTP
jgi:hypothetical protein